MQKLGSGIISLASIIWLAGVCSVFLQPASSQASKQAEAGVKQQKAKAEKRLKQAEKLIHQDRNKQALKLLNELIENDKRNSAAYFLRGNARFNLENYKDAFDDFSQFITLAPNNDEAKNGPSNNDVYKMRGEASLELENYEEAINDFSRCMEANKTADIKDAELYLLRSIAYEKSGRHKQALDDRSHALRLVHDLSTEP